MRTEPGDVREEDRDEVGLAARDGRAQRGAREKGVRAELALAARLRKRRRTRRVQVVEAHVDEVMARGHRLYQRGGRRRSPMDEDVAPAANGTDRIRGGGGAVTGGAPEIGGGTDQGLDGLDHKRMTSLNFSVWSRIASVAQTSASIVRPMT